MKRTRTKNEKKKKIEGLILSNKKNKGLKMKRKNIEVLRSFIYTASLPVKFFLGFITHNIQNRKNTIIY